MKHVVSITIEIPVTVQKYTIKINTFISQNEAVSLASLQEDNGLYGIYYVQKLLKS